MQISKITLMKITLIIASVLLILLIVTLNRDPINGKIEIYNTYTGQILTPADEGSDPSKIGLSIIKSGEDLTDFIKNIPEQLPRKAPPYPENTDPILKKPDIDFNEYMLITIIRNYMHNPPEITEIKNQDGETYVYYKLPEIDTFQAAGGWGTYSAVVIKKGEYDFVLKELK